MMKRWIWLLALCVLVLSVSGAQAQVIWQDQSGQVEVVSTVIDDTEWLFLPSGTDLSALGLTVDGETIQYDWMALSQPDGEIPGVYPGVLEQT